MLLSLRTKLIAIMVSTALAFVVIILASMWVTSSIQQQLSGIEEQQIPRLEIGPELDADFAVLRRSYQDAVAAREPEALERTNEVRDRILQRLDRGRDV